MSLPVNPSRSAVSAVKFTLASTRFCAIDTFRISSRVCVRNPCHRRKATKEIKGQLPKRVYTPLRISPKNKAKQDTKKGGGGGNETKQNETSRHDTKRNNTSNTKKRLKTNNETPKPRRPAGQQESASAVVAARPRQDRKACSLTQSPPPCRPQCADHPIPATVPEAQVRRGAGGGG